MIALGSDHGGFDLKERIKAYLDEKNIAYKDFGCPNKESCDYPVFGRAAAEAFMGNLKLAAIETHVADARTCCLHPASATHRQMNDEELRACGIAPELVRYSCGIENASDLIADLAQALDSIR